MYYVAAHCTMHPACRLLELQLTSRHFSCCSRLCSTRTLWHHVITWMRVYLHQNSLEHMFIYKYACACVSVCECVSQCVSMCLRCICVCVCVCACVYQRVSVCVCMCVCVFVHVCISLWVCVSVCVVYLWQVQDRVAGREHVTQTPAFRSL